MPFSLTALQDRLKTLIQPKPVKYIGQKLYVACVEQARRPVFYLDYGIEDAIGARFELLTFHVGLVIHALRAVAPDDRRREQALDTAQALFDSFLEALDNTLREQGTGDLTVPKKMKVLGNVIYTRMKRWDDLWAQDHGQRADYAARTVFAGSAYDDQDGDEEAAGLLSPDLQRRADAFAAYAERAFDAMDVDAVLRGDLPGCEIPALSDDISESSQSLA